MTEKRPAREVEPVDPSDWQTPAEEISVDAVLLTRHLPCGEGEIVIEIGVPHRVDSLLGTVLTEWAYGNLLYVCRYSIRGHRGVGSEHTGYMDGRDAFDALAAAMATSHSMALIRTDVEGEFRVVRETAVVSLDFTVAPDHRGAR